MSNHEAQVFDLNRDRATAARLAKLGNRPVEVRNLRERLESEFAKSDENFRSPASGIVGRHWSRRRWSAMSAAAVVALVAMLSAVFILNPPGASAGTLLELARLHEAMIEGRIPSHPVERIDEANAWIARQSATAPALPHGLNDALIQSCCLVTIRGRLVAVALIHAQGVPVTLVVADHPSFGHRMGDIYERNGRRFYAHNRQGVRMVMTDIDTRWLCVMGDLDDQTLVDLASQIRF